jgi:1-acyl-sn-glycerol-3-phosphate acyltransferase
LGGIGSSALAFVRACFYVGLTLPLMPVQALLVALDLPAARALPRWYHARCAALFGLEIRVTGAPAASAPTLFVSNHVSYLDIVVLSALAQVSFVAKTEIAAWPFFGWLAKLQRTVFVARRARALPTALISGFPYAPPSSCCSPPGCCTAHKAGCGPCATACPSPAPTC